MASNILQIINPIQSEVDTAQQKVDAVGWKADAAQQRVDVVQQEVDVAQHEVETAQQEVETSQQRVNIAKQGVDAAKQEVESIWQGADTTWWNAIVNAKAKAEAKAEAKVKAEIIVKVEVEALATAKAKVKVLAKALAKSEAEVMVSIKALAKIEAEAKALADVKAIKDNALAAAKAEVEPMVLSTTLLHDLATDCLRLSMQFFHPIQHCAQQVYHSALPLSPTSSQLQKSCLQNFLDKQLSHVAAFSGAPDTWGLLLRTISVRPRQLTSIATSSQRIIAACEDIVSIYDAVTFVLQQSLCAPETVTKIQDSPDGSILFFAHSFSVTMWDVQTGGLIYTFVTQSKINDFAVSTNGSHIACGLSDGSARFWDIHTKKQNECSKNSQPVVSIHWLLPLELVVVTQRSVQVYGSGIERVQDCLYTFDLVWGMVCLADENQFLLGLSQPGGKKDPGLYTFEPHKYTPGRSNGLGSQGGKSPISMPLRGLMCPMRVGNKIACITRPNGVQLFDTDSHNWSNSPPLLDAATSLAVSLNRNIVAQTKDSIQIFSLDVLETGKAHNTVRLSHVYPLGEKHILCLQPNGYLTLLELETLQELRPGDNITPPMSLPKNQLPSAHATSGGPVAELGVPMIMQMWKSGTTLPKWTEVNEEDESLSGLSPNHTRVVMVCSSESQQELLVKGVRGRMTLAKAPLEHGDAGTWKAYDLTFDSETRFYLKVEGPGWHVQIPYDIISSPSGSYSHTITQREPVPLSEPRVLPPFTLDANCEWVIDREARKICWISPGNLRRGNGGHFWAGLSLVMLGDDGVVRKLTMKEPESELW